MASPVIDEEALDSEALQAQIDLSMSFAQGLVSSWMDPRKFPKNTRKNDLEKELTEYMRRPPRLGVGASVPEGHQSVSRETARLKGKLVGSKRAREEEELTAAKKVFDEEGESRTVAIKKKARPDPFDVVHGKKKKKQKISDATLEPAPAISASSSGNQSKNDSAREVEASLKSSASPDTVALNSLPAATKTAEMKKSKETKNSIIKPVSEESSTPVDKPTSKVESPPPSPKKIDSVDTSLTGASSKALAQRLPPALANIPLLNLKGPPSEHDSDADAPGSPKKKRKRRKKKKHHPVSDSTAA